VAVPGDYTTTTAIDLFIGASFPDTKLPQPQQPRRTFTRVDDAATLKSPSNQHGTAGATTTTTGTST
jgi:hypothetical protein